jgi:uncharacterized protein YdaU (DUF1376 family)
MNFYKHHLGDYDGHTLHLTWMQDMAYTRLIRAYYRREQPLPADLGALCRLVRAARSEEKSAVAVVVKEFFVLDGDVYRNRRCDEEILKYQRQCEANRSTSRGRIVPQVADESKPNRSPNQIPEPEKDDTASEIWKQGVLFFTSGGETEDKARKLVGMFKRTYGLKALGEALLAAETSKPAGNRPAYLRAILQGGRRPGAPHEREFTPSVRMI